VQAFLGRREAFELSGEGIRVRVKVRVRVRVRVNP